MLVNGLLIVGTSPMRVRRWISAPGKIVGARNAWFAGAHGAARLPNHDLPVVRHLVPRTAAQKLAFGYCASFSMAAKSGGSRRRLMLDFLCLQRPTHA